MVPPSQYALTMTLEEDVVHIVSVLRTHVASLKQSLKSVEEQVPQEAPRSNLFEGDMIASLLAGTDAQWFPKFLHSLTAIRCQHLVLATLLAHQQAFKRLLLESRDLQATFLQPLKQFNPDVSDIDSTLWYKSLMYALIKSKADKPRIVAPQFKSAGLTFEEQSKLEESMAQNPNVAAAMGSGASAEEWSTSTDDANKILSWIISDNLIQRLVRVKAAEVVACICRVPEYRPLVVKNGGVSVITEKIAKSDSPELKEQLQVSLARLCMTSDPRIWKYPQVVELGRACFHLIAHAGYELYQFEAGFGLTNLLSLSEEVLEDLGSNEESIGKFFDLIVNSKNEQVQLVGTELVCNMCTSTHVVEKIAEGRYFEQLKIINFLIENASDKIQSAASGALAILSSNEELIPVIQRLTTDGDSVASRLSSENLSPEVELRMASIATNLADMSADESVREKMKDVIRMLQQRTKQSPQNQRLITLIESYE